MHITPVIGKPTPSIMHSVRLSEDGSKKFRFEFGDGEFAEAAYFVVSGRERSHIACVSTQVGCPVRCVFCAAAADGFRRQLTSREILHEVVTALQPAVEAGADEERMEVSFMGMGEPLRNLENVLEAIRLIAEKFPGMTRVSISTAGPGGYVNRLICRLPAAIPVHLQISLHATDRKLRDSLIPFAKEEPQKLADAAYQFHAATGDIVCVNYILLPGLNDTEKDVDFLAGLDSTAVYVKLTQLNSVPGLPKSLRAASVNELEHFASKLRLRGMPCRIFIGDGLDVRASCGQLAAQPVEVELTSSGR